MFRSKREKRPPRLPLLRADRNLSMCYKPYTTNEYMAGIKCFNCGLTFEPPYTYDTPEEAENEAVAAWNADSKRLPYVEGV